MSDPGGFHQSFDNLVKQNTKIREVVSDLDRGITEFGEFFKSLENAGSLKKIDSDRKDILKKIIEIRDDLLGFIKSTKRKIEDINAEKTKLYEAFSRAEALLSEFNDRVTKLDSENRVLKIDLDSALGRIKSLKWELEKKDKLKEELSSELELLKSRQGSAGVSGNAVSGKNESRKKITEIKELLRARGL